MLLFFYLFLDQMSNQIDYIVASVFVRYVLTSTFLFRGFKAVLASSQVNVWAFSNKVLDSWHIPSVNKHWLEMRNWKDEKVKASAKSIRLYW